MLTQLTPSELTLETDRLILTPLSHQDLDFAQGLLGDPDVMQFISDPMTPDQVAAETPRMSLAAYGVDPWFCPPPGCTVANAVAVGRSRAATPSL